MCVFVCVFVDGSCNGCAFGYYACATICLVVVFSLALLIFIKTDGVVYDTFSECYCTFSNGFYESYDIVCVNGLEKISNFREEITEIVPSNVYGLTCNYLNENS